MPELEERIAKDVTLYTIVGMLLRLMIFNLIFNQPLLNQVWLLVILSLCIGFGGASLNLGRLTNNKNYTILGLILVIIGLAPWHFLI